MPDYELHAKVVEEALQFAEDFCCGKHVVPRNKVLYDAAVRTWSYVKSVRTSSDVESVGIAAATDVAFAASCLADSTYIAAYAEVMHRIEANCIAFGTFCAAESSIRACGSKEDHARAAARVDYICSQASGKAAKKGKSSHGSRRTSRAGRMMRSNSSWRSNG